jgi:hypothetical protein
VLNEAPDLEAATLVLVTESIQREDPDPVQFSVQLRAIPSCTFLFGVQAGLHLLLFRLPRCKAAGCVDWRLKPSGLPARLLLTFFGDVDVGPS